MQKSVAPPSSSQGPPLSVLPKPQFFVDHKKGEVNELRLMLRNPNLDKD